jgi:hypothetical protein
MNLLKEIAESEQLLIKVTAILKRVKGNLIDMLENDEKEMNKMAEDYEKQGIVNG